MGQQTPRTVLARITAAITSHDLAALTACFTSDYESRWPLHPSRSFSGVDQVRENWGNIFGAVPDVQARVVSSVEDGDRVWAEYEFSGTRTDGAAFLMRGVIIVRARGDQAESATFYLEPVESDVDATGAVAQLVGDRRVEAGS